MGATPYQLLDSGNETKLEQAGEFRLIRPCPQAVWPRRLPGAAWATVDAVYVRSASGGGQWEYQRPLPPAWRVLVHDQPWIIKPTGFGHLGIFPEQEENWRWLQRQCAAAGGKMHALNLFAYTGGSTMAVAHAGGRITHVDAARGVVSWARDNAREQKLTDAAVQWLVEDATKFCSREVRRGHRYAGIVLDPPTFGRGPTGEMWKIESDLPALLGLCQQLLSQSGPAFLLLSCHTPGFSPLVLENLLAATLPAAGTLESGEMAIPERETGRRLPSGCFARWHRG